MKELSLTDFVKKTIDSLQAARPEGFELSDTIEFEVHVVVNQESNLEPTVDILKKGKNNDSSRSQKVTFSFVNPSKQAAIATADAKSTKKNITLIGNALRKQIVDFIADVDPTSGIKRSKRTGTVNLESTAAKSSIESKQPEKGRVRKAANKGQGDS